MIRFWNGLLHRVAVYLVGEPPPRTPPGVRTEATVERWPAFIPATNPLEQEPASGLRQRDVLSLMDPNCYGYLILTVRREAVGPRARIELAEQLEDSWWPVIARTCEEIAREARTA
jgi:hypothetical protein